jgi:hypothetical protein
VNRCTDSGSRSAFSSFPRMPSRWRRAPRVRARP